MPSGQTETLKGPGNNVIATTSLSYTYDVLGNIETITEGNTQKQKYYYDSLNQLTREDNLDLNQTIVYSYDNGGNITSTVVYPYQTAVPVSGTPTATNSYTYDSTWKDKLTAYNGSSITYDAIGNPTSYYNGYTFTWQKGRQLAGASNGTNTIAYTYNNDGYRTSKTVNGVLIQYTLEGDKVLFEWNGDTHLWYYYDSTGAPVGFSLTSHKQYIYRKNLQGDVTGIYSADTVIKMLLAGAKAVELCSVLLKNGLGTIAGMLCKIERWMDEKGFKSLADFNGKLAQENMSADGAYWERTQYMRTLISQ